MSSISISILLFELWLLRIFVFLGWILTPTVFVLRLNSHNIFWSCSFEDSQKEHVVSKSHVCEAVVIFVAQVNSHSSFLPARNVFFQCFLQNRVEEEARQRVTLFGSLFDLKHVAFFVCQYCGFLVSVQFFRRLM